MKPTLPTRLGFTLVELLSGILLGATVGTVTVQTIRWILLIEIRLANRALAWERGQNVLSILEPRVTHAALGLTFQQVGNVFQSSFGGASLSSPPPGRWSGRGPLQVWRGLPSGPPTLWELAPETGGVCRGRGLAVLYAVPSDLTAKLDGPLTLDGGHDAAVRLVPQENLGEVPDRLPVMVKNDLRSWVVFPLSRFPVHVSAYLAGTVTVSAAAFSVTIYPNDEMYYLRAERFQVQNDTLQSEELHDRDSWAAKGMFSRVEGVLEMWFEWNPAAKVLDVWVLTTGGPAAFGRSVRPRDWPAEAPWRDEFSLHDVTVVRASWQVRNL